MNIDDTKFSSKNPPISTLGHGTVFEFIDDYYLILNQNSGFVRDLKDACTGVYAVNLKINALSYFSKEFNNYTLCPGAVLKIHG